MASEVNFVLDQGSTFSMNVVYKDAAGNPVDLSNYSARSQARETMDSTTTLWNLVSPTNINLGANGEITLTVAATTTANYTPNKTYYYDLELVTGATVIRLLQGQIYVSPEVTR